MWKPDGNIFNYSSKLIAKKVKLKLVCLEIASEEDPKKDPKQNFQSKLSQTSDT